MSFKNQYQQAIRQAGFIEDPHQWHAVTALDDVHQALLARLHRQQNRLAMLSSLMRSLAADTSLKGCYLWGGVGRGKSWLMDLFYEHLPIAQKRRWHYHEFMLWVQQQLGSINNQCDPLKIVAKQLGQTCRVLCLDEFHVNDITDAMLLYGLLHALFQQGIVIVLTSNQAPDDLYKNGLQRARFLPAIELLKQKTRIINLQGDCDYRHSDTDETSHNYFLKATTTAEQFIQSHSLLRGMAIHRQCRIEINQRSVVASYSGNSFVGFDFERICGDGRATADYLAMAQRYDHLLIDAVPVLHEIQEDLASRFIHLVDAFYERKKALSIIAAAPIDDLYRGRRHRFEFARTISRIREMGSTTYKT